MLPILYSFRRCPYAMRARLAIRASGTQVILREVSLKAKPQAMLYISPKGTVPVLLLPDGRVIEQSLDVMRWALGEPLDSPLIAHNDGAFKRALDGYKYSHDEPLQHRADGEAFVRQLNGVLQRQPFLAGAVMGGVDWAIAPFVRQFAAVDAPWFAALPYAALHRWLAACVESALFDSIMGKYTPWQEGDGGVFFKVNRMLVVATGHVWRQSIAGCHHFAVALFEPQSGELRDNLTQPRSACGLRHT
ncbi:MAG: glutathione S-transferase [Formosimonas sp.]